MSFRSVRLLCLTICLLAFASLPTVNLSAQQPKVLAPHKPIAPTVTPQRNWHFRAPTQRSMVGGFWMIDANFRSTIYLKNGLKNAPITATPVLYLSNGKSFTLTDVHLDSSGTAVVNINDELGKQGIASWATLSGYVEVKYSHAWDPICVTLQDVDVAHSLIFTYRLLPSSSGTLTPTSGAAQQSQTVDAMWWRQESNVSGFVALSNVLAQPMSAKVQVSDNQGKPLSGHTVTVSPHGTKLVNLDELRDAPSAEGGITVSYQGPADGLLINGGLQDPGNGYSATIRFYPALALQAHPPTQGHAELGFMAGAADPMMSFPAGTVFTPYSVVRNITDQPIAVTPTLWWMAAGAPHSARLTQFSLPPQATQSLPVQSLMAQAGLKDFNGSVNLVLEVGGKADGLLMASGSVDQTNTYVFEVLPQGVGESASKAISYWSTGKGDDTMITLWNPADEAQDFIFTLFFSGGSYKYPISLGPRVTRTFNVSEIVRSQIPDVDGSLIPPTVHEGSAEIAGSRGETEQIAVAIAAGTYNVQKATCGDPCTVCNGVTGSGLQLQTFALNVGETTTESLIATFNTGSNQNYSSLATWSSSNTSVGTAQKPGTVKGVSGGTFTAYATTAPSTYEMYDYCLTEGSCPDDYVAAPATGTVPPNPTISNVIFSSGLALGAGGLMTITGTNFSSFLGAVTVVFNQGITTSDPVLSVATNTITANYQVTCSTLVGPNSFFVSSAGGDGGTGAQTGPWPVTVTLPAAPPPTIEFNGNAISGTQSVVVGQQIALTSSVSLPACMSRSSEHWTPSSSSSSGTPIGGYTANTSSGAVTPLQPPTAPGSTYTFFWVYPANSVRVTYQYTMSGGGSSGPSPIATATFNIAGPTGGSMTSTPYSSLHIANLLACSTGSGGPYLIYAGYPFSGTACSFSVTTAGIVFNSPTGYSNSSAGNFSLGQLISYDTLTGTGTSYGPGVDTGWPAYAGTAPPHNDNPKVYLPSSSTSVTRSFEATTFLMWTPNAASSCSGGSCTIPVPLGYQTWQFSGTAVCSTSCGTASNWKVTSSSAGLVGSFTASSSSQSSVGQNTLQYGYPTWTSTSF